jgi:glycosyltransferase involved in cell wall biosynthesis
MVEVLVVDNNSSDGSPKMVEKEFPQVRLLRASTNLGFGVANNLALQQACGRYFILLNSDAFLQPGAIAISSGTWMRIPIAAQEVGSPGATVDCNLPADPFLALSAR